MLLLLPPWPGVYLYAFRYRDRITGRWIRARYKATPAEIRTRYSEAEIIGPAEVRYPLGAAFRPWT